MYSYDLLMDSSKSLVFVSFPASLDEQMTVAVESSCWRVDSRDITLSMSFFFLEAQLAINI